MLVPSICLYYFIYHDDTGIYLSTPCSDRLKLDGSNVTMHTLITSFLIAQPYNRAIRNAHRLRNTNFILESWNR